MNLVRKTYPLLKSIANPFVGTVTHVTTSEPVAAITFDDGPDPDFTPGVLDILKKHDAHATFFMIGKAAERYSALVQQVAQAGHAIGNHTWDHRSFQTISGRERRRQIRACAKAVAPYGQRLFRPPYGDQSALSCLDVFLLRHKVITWNMHAFDWEIRDPKWMATKLEEALSPGSIILLHDSLWDTIVEGAEDRQHMLEALDMFLSRAGQKFRFVTVPELFRCGLRSRKIWLFNSRIGTYRLYRTSRL